MPNPAPSSARTPSGDVPTHKPYVPDDKIIPEFTWSAVLVGAVLGIVFGASSLYLVLKVGMTISASIPVAVLSITLFRVFSRVFGIRRATILENNIVQTTGSAGESIAFGVGITMPAVMILGFEMEITRVMVVSILGGVLGILMMIPLRRAFIVKQHGTLKYPEGTACADVLVIGETGGSTAKTVFIGFGLAFVHKFLMAGMRLWKDIVSKPLDWFSGATPAIEATPELLGVGYIIGTRVACIMVAGGILAYLVLVPAIKFFGEGLTAPLYPATALISTMDSDAIRSNYIVYIGAGAVATGGIIGLCRAMPLIYSSLRSGLRDMKNAIRTGGALARRTDRDMPMWVVFVGSILLVAAIWVFLGADPQAGGSFTWAALMNWTNLVAAVLIVLFGFLFVTVSSRLTGEIGSSSNPISGMTVATLLLTCLIFLLLGWTNPQNRLIALSVAAVVCIASSNGGTTSQDLKTGYLVGATPKYQQLSIVVGAVSSALVIGVILLMLNQAGTIYSTKNLPLPASPLDIAKIQEHAKQEQAPDDKNLYYVWHALEGNPQRVPPGKYLVDDQGQIRYLVDPGISGRLTRRDDGTDVEKYNPPQAQLFAVITDGILSQKLPWVLVLLGVAISLFMELCGISSLPFAVGVYLPLSTSTPIFAGGLIRYIVDGFTRRKRSDTTSQLESEMSSGVLFSTGYIAGGTIAGVLIACLVFSPTSMQNTLRKWQYRHVPISAEADFPNQCLALAKSELGEKASEKDLYHLASEIYDLNTQLPPQYVSLRKGMTLNLPGDKPAEVEADMTLGEFAKNVLGTPDKAASLLDLNSDRLRPPQGLPAGVEVRLPQQNIPSLIAFAALALILMTVGFGWIFKSTSVKENT
ncbi:MAG: oligopeptide transporter, OPT family [Thermoguttaceae bacterium]|jgi:putative OPT family oligopeptide transporter